ncbi:MAG: hypothetical protein ACOYXN_01070 [Acidobacteriota bacterium]
MKISSLERAFRSVNEMVREGVFQAYAVGGAMGALFYTEPSATYDLDIFVLLSDSDGALSLPPLARLYKFARAKGHVVEREHILLNGVPVQFLPAPSALVEEAVRSAVTKKVGTTPVKVMRPEHLAAIMVEVGRPKDRLRLQAFLAEKVITEKDMESLLKAHRLWIRWQGMKREMGFP